ncbi:MAG: hypothetical protein PT944_04195 [Actinomycetaceae bacterium]|nr:hypothetical protein [Arcanobacterium sp.]MDD7687105.1 hypothetical protein [Actinomycetaceae bacterium]MDY5273230.1 hypothetical protein [Arcanobacterium sp.]
MEHPQLAKACLFALALATIAHVAYHGPKDYRRLKELGREEFIAEKRQALRKCPALRSWLPASSPNH